VLGIGHHPYYTEIVIGTFIQIPIGSHPHPQSGNVVLGLQLLLLLLMSHWIAWIEGGMAGPWTGTEVIEICPAAETSLGSEGCWRRVEDGILIGPLRVTGLGNVTALLLLTAVQN
jgi:hypothetical protein